MAAKLVYLGVGMKGSIVHRIQAAVKAGLPAEARSLLAVSGGVDSMVLLHAARAVRAPADLIVATFDHASGAHAAAAVDVVERAGLSAGLSVVIGRATPREHPSEAAWREDRLRFLRAAAVENQAIICTAHTRDDQVETVLFRELRASGPRGLAGLDARGETFRPLLCVSRADVMDYARDAGVEWIDDPTNSELSFARNRLRHEIIPAMRAALPGVDDDLVAIGARAASWRADVDAYVDSRITFDVDRESCVLEVDRRTLEGLSDDALGILWPAILARAGVAADRRGTTRLVAFTTRGKTGHRIQLSGGWTVFRRRRVFEVRRSEPADG